MCRDGYNRNNETAIRYDAGVHAVLGTHPRSVEFKGADEADTYNELKYHHNGNSRDYLEKGRSTS